MKNITTKLKRYKICVFVINIIIMPIRLPIFMIYSIGKIAEIILNNIDKYCGKFIKTIVKKFNFDEIAIRQYETNKYKFERD